MERYVTSVEEVLWGGALVAVTMTIHGAGMVWVLWSVGALRSHVETLGLPAAIGRLVLTAWMILLVHLTEVLAWAGFFVWKGAMPNASTAYYFALMDYTTLGSDYHLPQRWRLLAGMLAATGLLAFAWSAGIMVAVAQEFQDRQLRLIEQAGPRRRPPAASPHGPPPADGR